MLNSIISRRRQVLKGREVDVILNKGPCMASESAKKVASKVAKAVLKTDMKKVGDKVVEYVAERIFTKRVK